MTFQTVQPLHILLYRVGYSLSGTNYWPPVSHADMLIDWLGRAYPVSDVTYTYRTVFWSNNAVPKCGEVNSFLQRQTVSTAPGAVLRVYGMVDDGGGFMRGCSPIPGRASSGPTGSGTFGWDTDGSYGDWYGAHEIGHSLGRGHVRGGPYVGEGTCGDEAGAIQGNDIGRYKGIISPEMVGDGVIFGFDIGTRDIYHFLWHDMMTYCDNQWISDQTYAAIKNVLGSSPSLLAPIEAGSGQTDKLLVTGSIDPMTNQAQLDTLFVLPDTGQAAPVPGDYAIVLRNSSGGELARYPFTPMEVHPGPLLPGATDEGAAQLAIFEMTPFAAGTNRVVIEGPGGVLLASVSAGAAFPTITVTQPQSGTVLTGDTVTVAWTAADADNDPLTFLVEYSPNNGQTWEQVTFPTSASSVDIDTDNLVSGANARFRVWVSDGMHTASAESALVSVPNHLPVVSILSPEDGVTAVISQTLFFEASAYDSDAGSMPDNQLEWQSNLDGLLGNGRQLSLAGLSTGAHTITFRADDGNGGVTTDQIQVTIVADPDNLPSIPDGLVAGPTAISFDPAGGIISDTLFIDNRNGAQSIAWDAAASEPWLQLSALSGDTPSVGVTVVFNDIGLMPGTHTAVITLTSPDVPGQTVEIYVETVVELNRIYLPFITR